MTGLDTNVLLRYLTEDAPVQTPRAVQAIEDAAVTGEKLLITNIVVCEFVWVLESSYHYGRDEIAPLLEDILRTRHFAFEDGGLLRRALDDYRRGKGGMSDYLIGRTGESAGCRRTLTFDRALRRNLLFELL